MKFASLFFCSLLLLSACGTSNEDTDQSTDPIPDTASDQTADQTTNQNNDTTNGSEVSQDTPAEPELETDIAIDINGEQRSYHLYDPNTPTIDAVVFLLHGNRGSADQILGLENTVSPFKRWMQIADEQNLMLVVPDGAVGPEGHQGWNDCRTDALGNPSTDDVLFISTLIDTVNQSHPRTDNRVFISGISNGGLMSTRLAEEIPNRLMAIAIIVASEPVNTKCVKSSAQLPILIMNGTADPILPYDGGQIVPNRGLLFSTIDLVNYWVERNQTNLTAEEVVFPDIDQSEDSTVTKYTYTNAQTNDKVVHYEVLNGGHTEPSVVERYSGIWKLIVGEQNGDIEMADEVWEFFSLYLQP